MKDVNIIGVMFFILKKFRAVSRENRCEGCTAFSPSLSLPAAAISMADEPFKRLMAFSATELPQLPSRVNETCRSTRPTVQVTVGELPFMTYAKILDF